MYLETRKKQLPTPYDRRSANLHEHSRYDRLDHLVLFSEQQRKCDVALHVKECFYLYHTQK